MAEVEKHVRVFPRSRCSRSCGTGGRTPPGSSGRPGSGPSTPGGRRPGRRSTTPPARGRWSSTTRPCRGSGTASPGSSCRRTAGRWARRGSGSRWCGDADGAGCTVRMTEDAVKGPGMLVPKPLRTVLLVPRNAETLQPPRAARRGPWSRDRRHRPVRTAHTSAAGYDLVVAEGGDPLAPAYVLVHGIGVSARYFGPLAEVARAGQPRPGPRPAGLRPQPRPGPRAGRRRSWPTSSPRSSPTAA